MKKIGICGKIGSGKSAVGVLLAEKGAFVLDLDVEMHRLYTESEELRTKISERFGAVCVQNGTVDRAALASQVFKDPRSLKDLEKIVYPMLQKHAENKLKRIENSENPPQIGVQNPRKSGCGLTRGKTLHRRLAADNTAINSSTEHSTRQLKKVTSYPVTS